MSARGAGGRSGAWTAPLVLLAFVACCQPAARPGPTELVFWQSWPVEVVQPLIAKFEAETTGVHVRIERIAREDGPARVIAAVDSGKVPDLCELDAAAMPGFLGTGALADWSAGSADLRPSIRGWEMCSVGETVYGIPWVLETRMLLYDRALFSRARLDPNRGPETWDELQRAAAAIQKLGGGIHGFGICTAEGRGAFEQFMPLAWGNGGRILSVSGDSAQFDSPENRAALAFYLGLRKVGATGSQDALEREFKRGRLGMLLAGPRLLEQLTEKSPGRSYGVTPVPRPATDRGGHASIAAGRVLVSFPDSKHKEAALRLARFLVRPENVLVLAEADPGVLPATVGADTAACYRRDPGRQTMIRQLETARFRPGIANWSAMEVAVDSALTRALLDRKSPPESAVARASAQSERAIAALLRKR